MLNIWDVWNWRILAAYIGWHLCRTGSNREESSFLYTDFQFCVSQSASYSKTAVKGAVYKTTAVRSKCEKWLVFQVVFKHFVIIEFSKSALCVCTFNSGLVLFHLSSCLTVKKLKHLQYEWRKTSHILLSWQFSVCPEIFHQHARLL